MAALAAVARAAPDPAGGQPAAKAEIGDNVAGAKGLESALKNLHAPLRETEPLSPADQLKAFKPQAGLAVDLVAAEPAVRQPLYLTFDERGRMWVLQYIQYPFPAGLKVVEYDRYIRAKFDRVPPPPPNHFKGEDVVSVHEDTDGDGTFDKAKTFVGELNIATAALPGRGGVWVTNPPYLLFYPDKNRDDVPDGDPVVHLSGFGLEDTHAVASSLAWGPDGWIYGAHGSTSTAKIKVEIPPASPGETAPNSPGRQAGVSLSNGTAPAPGTPGGPTVDFLGQLLWRYHPERHVFEIWAEGGGNTFGVAFDDEGRVYSGTNYGSHRGFHYPQGSYSLKGWGKHGPLTNPYAFGFFPHMPHEGNGDRLTHTFDVYGGGLLGEKFEGKIIAPNSLQSWVHVTSLQPLGSTFKTREEPFLVTCDDGWFRPVDLKTGPDGAVYLADLYERRISHVDPRDNWHRETGRIWRVRPADREPGVAPFDLGKAPGAELLKFLDHPNRWFRSTARRVLGDRKDASVAPALRRTLAAGKGRLVLEALWALNEVGAFDEAAALAALGRPEPAVRAWAARLLADEKGRPLPPAVVAKLMRLAAEEPDPHSRAQLASSAKRMDGAQAIPLIEALVRRDEDAADPHVPLLLWWALESKALSHREGVLAAFAQPGVWARPLVREAIMPRLARRYAADATPENQRALVRLFKSAPGEAERQVLAAGVNEAFEGGKTGEFIPELAAILAASGNVELALRGGNAKAHGQVLKAVADETTPEARRVRFIELLGQVGRPEAAPVLLGVAGETQSPAVRKAALAAVARFQDANLGADLVALYTKLPPEGDARPAAIATLLSRPEWAAALLKAVQTGTVPKEAVSAEQVGQVRRFEEKDLLALADAVFGKEQKAGDGEKQREFERVKRVVLTAPGDPAAGRALFATRCAACHTLFDLGAKVGPDLTGYERTNLDYMALNVVDPSASIREEYQTFAVRTTSGRAVVGIIAERGANQITLLDSTGQKTVVPKSEIKTEKALSSSTMPEGLLAGLSDKQVRDLFAFLASPAPDGAGK